MTIQIIAPPREEALCMDLASFSTVQQMWLSNVKKVVAVIGCVCPGVARPDSNTHTMSSKRSSSFRRAIANGRRTLQREILLDETGLGLYKRFVRYVAYEILPCETDRRWYFHQNRLCPPPIFIAIVTIVQIIVFMCYGIMLNKWVLQTYQPDFMKSPLVYHPGHRAQVWRFFSYMFMHVGLEQLGFNALLQLMIGVPLEMVHGILRISLLYMAGVLAVSGGHISTTKTFLLFARYS
ncbi:unnamed protein product [Pleuronectes platessa]|uniref:rhomboid protease n=1 Tax=Pleuronectes platessa TaxID=8262 RepID=A0A9N7VEQ7_PLEPL|nr:unnamed protein product [Pleuronectes platessa]